MEDEAPTKSKKKLLSWPLLIILILAIMAIIILGWFFTRGKVTTTGSNPKIDRSDSLVCEATGKEYPFFDYDNSAKKTTKITTIFADDKLDTISLVHTLYYNSAEEITKSEALNHAALNLSTQNAGLGPDVFNAHYSTTEDSMVLTLGANAKDINSKNSKYLLLNELTSGEYSKSVVKRNYQNKNFTCKENNN